MSAQQFALILKLCKRIDENIAKVRGDLKQLQALQGAAAAELNMLKERFDIHANEAFLVKQQEKKP